MAAAVSVLGLLDVVPVWAGLAHHTALPPLDLFADVRVLLAEAPSYPWFVANLVLVFVLRAVVLAAVLAGLGAASGASASTGEWTWRPGDRWWRPSRPAVRRALRFYGLALPPALLAGVLGFASVAAVYSLFLWMGVGIAIVALVVLGPRPWPQAERSQRPPARRRLRVLGYLAGLLGISLLSAVGTTAVRILLVWVSVGLTAAVARWLSGPVPWRLPRRAPVAVSTVATLLVAAVLAGERAADDGPPVLGDDQARPGSLFVVPGIGGSSGTSTLFRFDPGALGFDCGRTAYFSYAGPGDGTRQRQAACPITSGARYRAADTRRPVDQLAGWFRDQLAELEPPVVVVTHSQGAWVTAAALDGDTTPAVEAVVLFGAFPRHERGYVLDGTGAGVVGTDGMEALMALLRGAGATSFEPRSELPRELLGTAGAIDDLMRGLVRDTRVVNVTSALDVPVMADGWRLPGAVNPCPVPIDHGGLPTSGQAQRQMRRALAGEESDCGGGWQQWPSRAFTAFGAP